MNCSCVWVWLDEVRVTLDGGCLSAMLNRISYFWPICMKAMCTFYIYTVETSEG